jgi:SAM-dependent methyltransferase
MNGAVRKEMEKGDAPEVVAKTILAAATDPTPKRRYTAGKMARQVSMLRHFVPISSPRPHSTRVCESGSGCRCDARINWLFFRSRRESLVRNKSAQGYVMAQHNADRNDQSGERWVVHQARLDAMLAVFGQAALEAAAPAAGERVLDVGCGAGASSLALAARVGPGGQVLGVDISEPLIGRARALTPQDTPALFRVADASSAELPEGAFDILFSRFGVMFFDNPTGAFAHMRHALQPGGRVAFICWRGVAENDWMRLPMGAIKGIVPPTAPPDPEAPGPFSFGDRERVARILTAAGFTDIAIAPFDASVPFGEGATRDAAIDDAVEMAIEVGPLSRVLADQPDNIRARASAAVRAAFATRPGERSVMIDGAAWIVTARNPAS